MGGRFKSGAVRCISWRRSEYKWCLPSLLFRVLLLKLSPASWISFRYNWLMHRLICLIYFLQLFREYTTDKKWVLGLPFSLFLDLINLFTSTGSSELILTYPGPNAELVLEWVCAGSDRFGTNMMCSKFARLIWTFKLGIHCGARFWKGICLQKTFKQIDVVVSLLMQGWTTGNWGNRDGLHVRPDKYSWNAKANGA